MPTFNKVILIGNLTRDPQIHHGANSPVAEFGLAVNDNWRDRDGHTNEDTYFADCKVFGRNAENAHRYLAKGRPVLVEGRLKRETWTDKKTGAERSATRIYVNTLQFLGRCDTAPARPAKPATVTADNHDDVPF